MGKIRKGTERLLRSDPDYTLCEEQWLLYLLQDRFVERNSQKYGEEEGEIKLSFLDMLSFSNLLDIKVELSGRWYIMGKAIGLKCKVGS